MIYYDMLQASNKNRRFFCILWALGFDFLLQMPIPHGAMSFCSRSSFRAVYSLNFSHWSKSLGSTHNKKTTGDK